MTLLALIWNDQESIQSSRPPSLKLSRQKAISSSQEDVLETPRSPQTSARSAGFRPEIGPAAPNQGKGIGAPPRRQSSEEEADNRSGQHVVTIEDVTQDDNKDLEETSM